MVTTEHQVVKANAYGMHVIRQNEWYYNPLTQGLHKWTKPKPLFVSKTRGVDLPPSTENDYERV